VTQLIYYNLGLLSRAICDGFGLEEYDFRDAVKGKYSVRYSEGTNVIVIDKDVMAYFPDHNAVNQALRSIISIKKT